MLTAKSIAEIMRMRQAFGITEDGSCFGVTDPSRLRDTQNAIRLRYLRDSSQRKSEAPQVAILCENPFCQHELGHAEKIDHVGTSAYANGGERLRVCHKCYELYMLEPF